MNQAIKVVILNKGIQTSQSIVDAKNPNAIQAKEGMQLEFTQADTNKATDQLVALRDKNDLVVLDESGNRLFTIENYYGVEDIEIGTTVDGGFVVFEFASVQAQVQTTESVITLSDGETSPLVYEILDSHNSPVLEFDFGAEVLMAAGAALGLTAAAGGGSSGSGSSDNHTTTTAHNKPGSVVITGELKQGSTLTATLTDEDGIIEGSAKFVWYADGTPIVQPQAKGATTATSSILLTQNEVGKTITVEVTYTDGFGNLSGGTGSVTTLSAEADGVVVAIDDTTPPLEPPESTNTPPTSSDTTITTDEDQTKTGQLNTAQDADGDTLTYALATNATNGTAVVNADGSYSYTPNADYTGADTFTYTIDDGNGGVITQTANVTVEAVTNPPTNANNAPTSADASVTWGENATYAFKQDDFSFTDSDGNALAAIIVESLPDKGTLTLNSTAVTTNQSISLADIQAAMLTFTPEANTLGNNYTNFDFKVQDDGGIQNGGQNTSSTHNLSINVVDVNDAPIAFAPREGDVRTNNLNNHLSFGKSITLQDDNKVLVAGYKKEGRYGDDQVLLMRFNADGTPDTDFNANGSEPGAVIIGFSGEDKVYSVFTQADGKILVAGEAYELKDQDSYSRNDNFLLLRFNSDGSLDESFGDTSSPGKVTTNFALGNDTAYSLTIDNDGKILLAGVGYDDFFNDNFMLVRYNTDGSLDTSLNPDSETPGIVTTDLDGSFDKAYDVVCQPDGKILLAGYGDNYDTGVDFMLVRYNHDGSLDDSFNANGATPGIVTTDYAFNENVARSLALQDDGKILLAGYNYRYDLEGSTSDFMLARYNSDGSLDKSFGGNTKPGIVLSYLASDYVDAYSMAIQKDGKIIVVGEVDNEVNGSGTDIILVRYNPDGSLDTSFNADGPTPGMIIEKLAKLDGFDSANDVVVRDDGTILIVADVESNRQGAGDIVILSYSADGTPDRSFASNDINIKAQEDVNYIFSLSEFGYNDFGDTTPDNLLNIIINTLPDHGSIQLDGETVTAGQAISKTDIETGKLTFLSDADDFGEDYARFSFKVQDDGGVDLGGQDTSGAATLNIDVAPAQDGVPIFSPNKMQGLSITDHEGNYDEAKCITTDAEGKILVAGYVNKGLYQGDLMIVHYNADGSLDTSFNSDGILSGIQTTDISGHTEFIDDMLFQADGKVLVIGHIYDQDSNGDFSLARYNADGTLDTSFNPDGVKPGITITDLGNRYDQISKIATQADGKILVAGISGDGSADQSYDFVMLRFNTDGTLDDNFNADGSRPGFITTDFDGRYFKPSSIITLDDGKILVAGTGHNPELDNSDFMLVRYNSNGTLDTSFNAEGDYPGIVTTNKYYYDEVANCMTIDKDGNIILAGSSTNSWGRYIQITRYDSDGSLDDSFGQDGTVITQSPVSTAENIYALEDGKILISGNSKFFDLARYNHDGSIDTSYNAAGENPGFASIEYNQYNFSIADTTVLADGAILLTGRTGAGTSIADPHSQSDFFVARVNADGTLDSNFGGPLFDTTTGLQTYTEDSTVVLHDTIGITDVDALLAQSYDGTQLIISRSSQYTSVLDAYGGTGNLSFNAEGEVVLSNTVIGTYERTDTQKDNKLTINFNANASQEAVDEAMQSITFTNHFLDRDETAQIDWFFSDNEQGYARATQQISMIADTEDAPLRYLFNIDGTIFSFLQPLQVGDDLYYRWDTNRSGFIGVDNRTHHNRIDDFLNEGNDTTDSQRSREIEGLTFQLPTIDDLLIMYNDENRYVASERWNEDQLFWSSTLGSSENTHMALNIATGEQLELADTEYASVAFQIL